MMERFRNQIRGTMGKVLLVLFTIPFVLFGIDTMFTSGGPQDVATVNGEAVTEADLEQQLYLSKRELMARMGNEVNEAMLEDSVLRGPALQALVRDRVFQQAADDFDLRISKQQLDKLIVNQEEFFVDGKFNPEAYEMILRNAGLSPAQYKQLLGNQLVQNQLISGFYSGSFLTDQELEIVARVFEQHRDLSYFIVPLNTYQLQVQVSDGEVRKYYDENPDKYMTPEQVAVNYIELRLSDFYEDIPEEEIRAQYEAELKQREASKQRAVAHILLNIDDERSEAQAVAELQQLKQRIVGGEDFASLAAQFSEDSASAASGGELGLTDGTVFPEKFEAAVAELKVGGISDPVVTDAGVHLIKLLAEQDAPSPSLEELRPQIEAQIQHARAEPLYVEEMETLADLSYGASELGDVAEKLNLKLQSSGYITRDGADSGIFSDRRVIDAAFSDPVLKESANSEIIELGNDHSVVLHLNEYRKSQRKPFEEVSESIREALRADKARQQALAAVAEALAALESGTPLGEVAAQFGVETQQFVGVSRGEPFGVSPAILEVGFAAQVTAGQKSRATATLDDGSVAVIEVSNVVDGDLAAMSKEDRDALRRLLLRDRARSEARDFERDLQNMAEIQILAAENGTSAPDQAEE